MNTTEMAWTQAWQLPAQLAAVAVVVMVAAKSRPRLAHVLWLVVLCQIALVSPSWRRPTTQDKAHELAPRVEEFDHECPAVLSPATGLGGGTSVIENDGIRFHPTSGALISVSYSVAGLATPVRNIPGTTPEDRTVTAEKTAPQAAEDADVPIDDPQIQDDFASLMNLIKAAVAPESWDDVGGSGSIMPDRATVSLIICQRQSAHEEIAFLLAQLRHLQHLQVILQVDIAAVSEATRRTLVETESNWVNRSCCLNETQAKSARELVEESSGEAIIHSPNITLHNGQRVKLTLPGNLQRGGTVPLPPLQFVPVISADRRYIRLKVAVGATPPLDAQPRGRDFVIQEGQSLLADITADLDADQIPSLPHIPADLLRREQKAAPAERVLLLITQRVIDDTEGEAKPLPDTGP